MEYRKLGKSGLLISEFSLGSWLTFGKQVDQKVADQLMGYAFDNGVNFFDNAEIYARGASEVVMGKILKAKKWDRSKYLVSSKVFFGLGDAGPNERGLSRKHIVEGCHGALRRMQLEYIDLFYCHRPDKATPIVETVWTMHQLVMQGKILYWGTSEWSAAEIMEAHRVAALHHLIGPVVEQPEYNMFRRDKVEKEFHMIYQTVGLGTTIWSPLASGVLSGKYNNGFPKGTRLGIKGLEWLKEQALTAERLKKVQRLAKIAEKMESTLPKLALAWCLKNENVSSVILGASKLSQLKENLKSPELLPLLDQKTMDAIEKVLDNKPKMPLY